MSDLLGPSTESHGEPGAHKPAASKADKRKQTIIAITAVVGVLLTYLLWRRSTTASASSGDTSTPQPEGVSDAGTGGGASNGDYSGALNAVGSELSQLQTQIGTLTTANGNLTDQLGHLQDVKSAQGAQIHHLATVVQSHEKAQISQQAKKDKQIHTLEKQVHALKGNAHAAHKNTAHHKKAVHK